MSEEIFDIRKFGVNLEDIDDETRRELFMIFGRKLGENDMDKTIIDNNTIFKNPTYFARGVELVQQAQEHYKLPSENWTYPHHRFGDPEDNYYAEIWTSGMDWTIDFWLLECKELYKAIALPLMHFESNEEFDKFNDFDIKRLCKAAMAYRRFATWLEQDPKFSSEINQYEDIWSYLWINPTESNGWGCPAWFQHANQERVTFWINNVNINFNDIPNTKTSKDIKLTKN